MEPIEVVQKTLRWLKENPDKWCTGTATDADGRHCAVGVLTSFDFIPMLALDLIRESYKDNPQFNKLYLTEINDFYGYDTVIEILEKTVADNTESIPEESRELITA